MNNYQINPTSKSTIEKAWLIAAFLSVIEGPLGFALTVALLIYQSRNPEKVGKHILIYGLAELIFPIFIIAWFTVFTGFDDSLPDSWIIFFVLLSSGWGLISGILNISMYAFLSRKKYLLAACENLINGEHITSLRTISDILGVEYLKVKKAVALQIKNGHFKWASIDDKKEEIIFERSIWAKQPVVCERCGAELVVDFGATLICEYCSSALKVKRIDPGPELMDRRYREDADDLLNSGL